MNHEAKGTKKENNEDWRLEKLKDALVCSSGKKSDFSVWNFSVTRFVFIAKQLAQSVHLYASVIELFKGTAETLVPGASC